MEHKCGDCGQATGKLHTENCDIERCPKCKGQLLSCDCQFPKKSTDRKNLIDDKGKSWKRFLVGKSVDEDFSMR